MQPTFHTDFNGNPRLFVETLRYGRANDWKTQDGYNFAFLGRNEYAVCVDCIEKNLYGVLLAFAHAYKYPKAGKYQHYLLGTFVINESQTCHWCKTEIPCNLPTASDYPSWQETWNHTRF